MAVTRISSTNLVHVLRWTLTSAEPEGTPLPDTDSDLSDRSVQVYGDLGGGTVEWQGTSDPGHENWVNLSTTGGSLAAFSAPGIKQILESTLYARPVLVGSSGADCTVIAVCRKPFRG